MGWERGTVERGRHSAEAATYTLPSGTSKASSNVEVPVPLERQMPVVIVLTFLPWTAVVFFTAGGWATLNLILYAIAVLAIGYSIFGVLLPAPARSQVIVLAPATGILVISALTAFWVRLRLPLIWVPALWLALAVAGVLSFWRDRAVWAKSTCAHGLTLAIFSALVCALCFLPSACNDLVTRCDGSFNWKYMDTQHFHSIAASIKNTEGPPKTPGTVTAGLFYHFGPYAPAAAISRLDGLDLGDALARVTRGTSLWALVLSCFGLGTLLSLKVTGRKFGGIMSVVGLFFYGSLSSLFTDEVTSTGHLTGAILFRIPGLQVLANGSPFDQLLSGHSLVHGLGAVTAIMGLCLVGAEQELALTWRSAILLVLPALAVPVNSLAALYCIGLAGILLFWGRLLSTGSWLAITLMVCVFLVAWEVMGYGHAPDAARLMIKEHVTWQWWTLAVWFIVGLGFRIVGFSLISHPLKDPLSAMVLASVSGFLSFSLLLQLRDANERYGIYFLQSILSVFSFSQLTPGCWRGAERSQMIAAWLRGAKTGLILLIVFGALIGCFAVVTHHHTGITHFGGKLFLFLLLLSLLAGASALMTRSPCFSKVGSTVLMGVLMVGFLAWTTDWIRYGLGRVKTDITYAAGEVRGLRRLGKIMAPDERFATNKHALDMYSVGPPIARSYGYSALSERRVLLEGYLARGETELPWFNALLHDNDLLFNTKDPKTLREIAKKWRVRWLVARRGTDISLPRPLPAWLVEQQDCGDLRIYRID